MTGFTKPAAEVFAPTTAGGAPRGADIGEAQVWGVEVEANIAAVQEETVAAVEVITDALSDRVDAVEDLATSGVKWTTHLIEGRSTGNVNLANGLENGDTLNGLTVQTGKHYFLGLQTNPAENGIYTAVASGAASRATFADSAAELAYIGFVLQGGTVGAGEGWTLNLAAADIVVGTTALNFSPALVAPSYAAEVLAARGGEASLNARVTEISARAIPDWVTVVPDGSGGFIVPKFEWDIPNGRVWLNGKVKAVADLTDNGDGSYDLPEMIQDVAAGLTLFAKVSRTGGTPSGGIFGVSANKTSLAGEAALGINHHVASDTIGAKSTNRLVTPVTEPISSGWGVERMLMAVDNAGAMRRKIEGSPVASSTHTPNFTTPTFMTVGAYARNTRLPLANATVQHVIAFSGALTEAQIETLFDLTHPDYGLEQEVIPHWVPRVRHESTFGYRYADLAFDYSRGRCWFNGRERDFDDVFVDAAGGDFTLIKPPKGLTTSTGMTFFTDTLRTTFYDNTQTPDGTAFYALLASGVSSLAERVHFEISTSNIPPAVGSVLPGGLANNSCFVAKAGAGYALSSAIPSASSGVPLRGQGILRNAMSIPASGALLTFQNAGSVKSQGTVASYVPQDWFVFGAKHDGTDPLVNVTLVQGGMFCTALSTAQMDDLAAFNEYGVRPLFFIGDSINNVQSPAEMLMLHYDADGYSYLPWWSDGKGSRGMNWMAEFIDAYTTFDDKFRDYILVMVEGGFDYSGLALDGVTNVGPYSERDIQGYLRDIRYEFREPLWVWMESNSNLVAETDISGGVTTGMTAWRKTQLNIKETYPAAFCATMALMQAQAETDVEYDAIRVDGRIATHLRGDGIHFPWGTAYSGDPADESGYYWWSRALQTHLAGMNWPRKAGS